MNMRMISIILSLLICNSDAAGFNYPDAMPDPLQAHVGILEVIIPFIGGYETPIAIRFTSIIDSTFWNCVAVYHPTALDAITKEEPRVSVDSQIISDYGTSDTRMLCGAYAIAIVADYIMPESTESLRQLLNSWNLDESYYSCNGAVEACDIDDIDCLQNAAENNNFTPEIIGSIIAFEIIDYLQNDGWNDDGSIGINDAECTANCRPYADTTGYKPKGSKRNNRWEPLMEDNGKGFSYYYNHITPHIGYKAALKVISRNELKSRSSPDPEYDYKMETKLVIDRLADLATNDTQKMLVEFFDDKIAVAIAIFFELQNLLQWSYEETILWLVGYTAIEYDAVILSWREKRNWDLVRPTTLIKRKKNKKIKTYGGPYQNVQKIRSRDFESYIRVMPHSEYPSGSGCICLVAAQYTDKYLEDRYNITTSTSVTLPLPNAYFPKGTSKIEPGVTPKNDLYATMKDLTELSNICGESRLWGGMHFTASIQGSHQLCDGIGKQGYEYIVDLLNGCPL